eukprot:838518-Prorocentrum_minimum.AAC.1
MSSVRKKALYLLRGCNIAARSPPDDNPVLAYLDLDNEDAAAPDFAAALVYSCSASCQSTEAAGGSTTYAEEWVWVQPPLNE